MPSKVEKCHTVLMIHGECKNYWCYAYGICALCKQCDDCCRCAFLPCQECICDACKEQISKDNEQISKLTNERDTARRMYCVMAANVMYKSENKLTAEHIANDKNWDCYKKEENK